MRDRLSPRPPIAVLAVAALVAGTFVVSDIAGSLPASATTSGMTTGADRFELAGNIASDYFTLGADTVVVAQDSATSAHLAGAVAAVHEWPVLVSESGTTAAGVLPGIAALGATEVVLVSSTAGWFDTTFRSELVGASLTIAATHDAADTFTRWSAAAGLEAEEYALARSDDSEGLILATSYAVSVGVPLVVWEPATSATLLTDFFDATPDARLVFFNDTLVPTQHMEESRIETLTTVPLADLKRAFVWVASQAQLAGRDSSRVFVAAADRLDELALAGVAAAASSSIVAPAGTRAALSTASRAHEYLTLWKSGANAVALIGSGLTTGDLTSVLAPTATSHPAAPAFRPTAFTRGTSSYTISVTSVSGATSYKLYDASSALVASSSTPELTFTSVIAGGLVVADGPAGEIARLDVHLNSYGDDDDDRTIALVGANGGTNTVLVLSDIDTPRLITRSVTDWFGWPPMSVAHEPIAITCAKTFTDVTGDATMEYEYTVMDFTNVDVRACDPLHPNAPALLAERVVATVSAPPTEFPWLRSADTPRASGVTSGQAMVNRMLDATEAAEAARESGAQVARGPGDDWPIMMTRWIAYIPEPKIIFPGFSGDLAKPLLMFGGDGHGTNDPNGSVRFRQDVDFRFGSSHSRTYGEHMGTTHLYKCASPNVGCSLLASATAPLSELTLQYTTGTPVTGTAALRAEASNPLVGIAPPIDTMLLIKYSANGSYLTGYHDNMPKHEFYQGEPYSEWYKMYESPYISYAVQLHCLYSSPTSHVPGCAVTFNVLL